MQNKKAQSLSGASTAVIALVVIAVVLGIGASILDQFAVQQCAASGSGNQWFANQSVCGLAGKATPVNNSYAINSSLQGFQAVKTFSDFQTTIAIVVVAGVLLTIIFGVLIGRRMGG